MTFILFILIVIVCVILSLVVLIQNPKGGGLSGTIAGFNNQFMGVKQTTDVLEKGTWLFVSILSVLSIVSILFISGPATGTNNKTLQDINTSTVPTQQAPASQQKTPPKTLNLGDTNKK
jgi:preprotein translocase subunit SecG